MLKNLSAILLSSFLLVGCASHTAGEYTRSNVGQASTIEEGVIVKVKPVVLKDNGLGTLTGAAVGGVLGHQVGGGKGQALATVGGALLGGIAGNKFNEKEGYEVWIKMPSGRIIKTVTEKSGFHEGDRVYIEFSGSKMSIGL